MELPAQGLARASVCRSRRGAKPAFPTGIEDRLEAGFADLKAAATSSSAPCDYPPHSGTWLQSWAD